MRWTTRVSFRRLFDKRQQLAFKSLGSSSRTDVGTLIVIAMRKTELRTCFSILLIALDETVFRRSTLLSFPWVRGCANFEKLHD